MKMMRSKALVGAGAVLILAALVSPLNSSAFKSESDKTEKVESLPTKNHAKVEGVWTYDCEFPVQRPEQIMLTCADGKRVDVPVIVNLSEIFKYKGRNVLRTLDIEAVGGR
jgi:hypothetical protein